MGYYGGVVSIELDGTTTTFDRYAAAPRCDVDLFYKDGLENASHTLTVALSGISPKANTTGPPWLQFQYIQWVAWL